MALQPETEYQAEDYGEATGSFIVTSPMQVNGNWVAEGQWRPQMALDNKLSSDAAKAAASQPKKRPSAAVMTGDPDDGPPVLKRPGAGGTSDTSSGGSKSGTSPSGTSSSGTQGPSPSSDGKSGSSTASSTGKPSLSAPGDDSSASSTASSTSGRPTLARPGDEPVEASSAPATGKTQATHDDDPDRPTLKNSSPSSTSSAGTPTTSENRAQATSTPSAPDSSVGANDADPSRPVLQRGKPVKPMGDDVAGASPVAKTTSGKLNSPRASGSAATTAAKSSSSPQPALSYPAVSDAGTFEMRPLLYSMSSGEKEKLAQQMTKLAMDEIRVFTTKRSSLAPGKTAAITDYDLRAFDLDFNGSPTVVLTAKLPVTDTNKKTGVTKTIDYFVTVVAHVDANGEPQKFFSSVTNNNYLDAFPRMELIGAVDADANGRGDLLFRQYSDGAISYGLYRVFPYQLQKVFEGGSSM
jgi:hypothetical protein